MRRPRSVRLVLALALVAGATVGLATSAGAAVAQVDVLDFDYAPGDLTVTEGDTIVFRWRGQDAHTVTAFDESFDSGTKYPGDDFAVTFESPGEYAYFCTLHGPQMSGVIDVMPEDGTQISPATDDKVAEAIAWSQAAVADGGAPIALIGRDDVFADSLASGGVQGALGAPLLLNPSDELDDRVTAELERIGAGQVVLLGGENALSADVATSLEAEGYAVDRVAGVDRIATAVKLARRYFNQADEAILVRARGSGSAAFADSLGAGALAAKLGMPVVLTPTDTLSNTTKSYLESAGVTTVHIAGGTAAVSQEVEDALVELGFNVNRIGGATRFDTNALLAQTGAGGTFDPDEVVAVIDGTGSNTDAWVSGFAAALLVSDHGVLIVANGDQVADPYMPIMIEHHPAVVCGPDTAACDFVLMASNVNGFFEPGNIFALANEPTAAEVDGERAALDLRATRVDGMACWFVANGGMTPIVASHIHKVSDNLPVLDTGEIAPGPPSYACGSETNDGDLAAIFASPADYYWNVHFDGTSETVKGEVVVPDEFLLAFGTGDQEVPPVEADGVGFSLITFPEGTDDTVCLATQSFIFGEAGPKPITGLHIHEGAQGVNGPVAIGFDPPPAGNIMGGSCESGLDLALVADIEANPNDYYVNHHTGDNPSGEVRGQLVDPLPAYGNPFVVS